MITTRHNFDLTGHTTFAMPVSCKSFIEYDDAADIPAILAGLPEGEPLLHLGAGSNILFTRPFAGTVLHSAVKGVREVSRSDSEVMLEVGAGTVMTDLINHTCALGLWGLENLAGIPGEVGSAAVQNVGAYGVEAGDIIAEVKAWDRAEERFVSIPQSDCRFGYRDSLFKQPEAKGRYIIHAVTFRLCPTPAPRLTYPALAAKFADAPASPAEVAKAVIEVRGSKLPDPAEVPSAGSFFKNPVVSREVFEKIRETATADVPHYPLADGSVKIPAAWLIEQCGWKGQSLGRAAVWHLQPLVIVNPGRDASPEEIIALERAIVQSVSERFGITLSPEVEHI